MDNLELLTPNKIIFSKRKSISLVIDTKGEFFVRAPYKCSETRIIDFINKKADWIIKKRSQIKNNIKYPHLKFVDGEKVPLFDNEYNIVISDTARVKTDADNIYIPSINPTSKLIAYLRKTLKKYLTVRIEELSKKMQVKYLSISISSARTNWGSCSSKNKLHFTYRLAMCPTCVVDYIILHELSHILVKNHSREFWLTVEKYCPNYKQAERWLKDNRYIIDII